MAFFKPQTHLRDKPLQVKETALLLVDIQKYNASREGTIYKSLSVEQKESKEVQYFFNSVDEAIPRWKNLVRECRNCGVQVVFTVIQSLTKDGRDRSLDYKISGFHCPPGSDDAAVLTELSPGPNEPILPKTSSSLFQSTVCDFILRNLGIKQLIIAGCVSDQCVEHAVRDACDLGYLVTLVTDACCTYSKERQESSQKAVSGYCRQLSTAAVIRELQQ